MRNNILILKEEFSDKQLRRLKKASLAVLLHLSSRVQPNGMAMSSLSQICEATGYSKTAVRSALIYLEKKEWMRISKLPGPNGFDRNVYHLIPANSGIDIQKAA